jgi:hypothetical protein
MKNPFKALSDKIFLRLNFSQTISLLSDAYDSLVFLSAGQGFIDVFEATTNEYHIINRIKTHSGARTSLWLPSEKKLLLAVPAE